MKDKLTKKLYVKVASPFETYYEGDAYVISAQNKTGPFDILPDHANFISVLEKGEVKIHLSDRKVSIPVDRGIVKVSNNRVKVFVNV